MNRTLGIVLGVVLVLAVAAGVWMMRRPSGTSVDLVEAFRGAEKTSTLTATAAFSMDPQTIKGVTRPSIYMHPTSRVTYRSVTVPPGGRLRAYLGIKEEAWDKGTDGVLFRMAVSTGGQYTELVTRHVDPFHNAADRDWLEVSADLKPWAGTTVDLIFNTNSSVPGVVVNDLYDFAIIGAPAIVTVGQS